MDLQDELLNEMELVQDLLYKLQAHKDAMQSFENEQITYDCNHINRMFEKYQGKLDGKLVDMLRYFKLKFSGIYKSILSRYTERPWYFTKSQILNPSQYIGLG